MCHGGSGNGFEQQSTTEVPAKHQPQSAAGAQDQAVLGGNQCCQGQTMAWTFSLTSYHSVYEKLLPVLSNETEFREDHLPQATKLISDRAGRVIEPYLTSDFNTGEEKLSRCKDKPCNIASGNESGHRGPEAGHFCSPGGCVTHTTQGVCT